MKNFQKIALVSAMAFSANTMAMQALDDETLSAATGQDGIAITISTPTTGINIDKINIHDTDGITAADLNATASTSTEDGAIILGNHFGGPGFKLDTAGGAIGLKIDAGATTNGEATLNVNVSLPNNLKITTGDIGVAASNGIGAVGGSTAGETKILDSMDVTLGATEMNIQLGHEEQGAMIKLSAEMVGGLSIDNIKLNDAGGAVTGGSLFVEQLKVTGAGGGNLELDMDIDIDAAGLVITDNTTTGNDIFMKGLYLGAAPTAAPVAAPGTGFTYTGGSRVGDIEMLGLNMSGTQIRISGK